MENSCFIAHIALPSSVMNAQRHRVDPYMHMKVYLMYVQLVCLIKMYNWIRFLDVLSPFEIKSYVDIAQPQLPGQTLP